MVTFLTGTDSVDLSICWIVMIDVLISIYDVTVMKVIGKRTLTYTKKTYPSRQGVEIERHLVGEVCLLDHIEGSEIDMSARVIYTKIFH